MPAETATFDIKSLLIKTLAGIALLFGLVALIGYTLREPLFALSRAFVDLTGALGIAAGFFFADTFPVPWPHDAFLAFGIFGGLSFGTVVFYASAGSILGGCLGYTIASRVARFPRIRNVIESRAAQVHGLVERYGELAVAVGALFPLPYSLTAWAAGLLGMKWWRFFAVSFLRIPRVAAYLWLIQTGVLTFSP